MARTKHSDVVDDKKRKFASVNAKDQYRHLEDALDRARADDLETNDGLMFGAKSVNYFTMNGKYPETWSCLGEVADGWILLREPSHPCQRPSHYIYQPSDKFGGRISRCKFVPHPELNAPEIETADELP